MHEFGSVLCGSDAVAKKVVSQVFHGLRYGDFKGEHVMLPSELVDDIFTLFSQCIQMARQELDPQWRTTVLKNLAVVAKRGLDFVSVLRKFRAQLDFVTYMQDPANTGSEYAGVSCDGA